MIEHKTRQVVVVAPLVAVIVVGLAIGLVGRDHHWREIQPGIAESTGLGASAATVRYVLNASQSKFIAHAHRGGLFWFKGHDHYLAAREFSGEGQITPDAIVPATLRIVVKASSLVETGKDFTDQQKQIINKEVHDIVLQPDQYPEIVLESTAVSLKGNSDGQREVRIDGNLTLHGVTKRGNHPGKGNLEG